MNAGPDFWCAAHRSKSASGTVNARNFMFACDAPQYSAQKPFHTSEPIVESGVNQR
jgi:hypothetical protein